MKLIEVIRFLPGKRQILVMMKVGGENEMSEPERLSYDEFFCC